MAAWGVVWRGPARGAQTADYFTPKRMLRHPKAVSTIDELMSGTFHEMLDDVGAVEPARVELGGC